MTEEVILTFETVIMWPYVSIKVGNTGNLFPQQKQLVKKNKKMPNKIQ